MKRKLTIPLFVFLALIGCKKNDQETNITLDNKIVINEIFKSGMAWHSQISMLRSSQPVNLNVDTIFEGSGGGVIRVMGNVNGMIDIDENTGEPKGGTLSLGLKEIISDFAVIYNEKKYNIDGAPNIYLTGSLNLFPYDTFVNESSNLKIEGSIHVVVGNDYDKVVALDLNMVVNALATGGHITGTYDGELVDFSL